MGQATGQLDVVTMVAVLHYLDVKDELRTVSGLLAPGGRFLVNEPPSSRKLSRNQIIWRFTHLARGNTTGPGTIHRVEPQTPDEPPPPPSATTVIPAATPYTARDWEQAIARRRADQKRLRGIDRTLDEADRRAAELNRRLLALLADQ